jgi:hypothetical protein
LSFANYNAKRSSNRNKRSRILPFFLRFSTEGEKKMCPQSFKKIYRDCRKIKLTEMGRQGRLAETAHPNKRPLTTEEMVAELVAVRLPFFNYQFVCFCLFDQL